MANRSRWRSSIPIPNSALVHLCGFCDASQLAKARSRLIELGLITYSPGGANHSGIYKIMPLYDEVYTSQNKTFDNRFNNTSDTVSNKYSDSIYKKNNNETKEKKYISSTNDNCCMKETDNIDEIERQFMRLA